MLSDQLKDENYGTKENGRLKEINVYANSPKCAGCKTPIPYVAPRMVAQDVPKTAKKRRQRNRRQAAIPTNAIKGFVFSARWLSLGLLLFTIFALYVAATQENFYLTTIPVEGTITIPPSEIVSMSGLAGSHIFAADPHEAAMRIAELPGVVSN